MKNLFSYTSELHHKEPEFLQFLTDNNIEMVEVGLNGWLCEFIGTKENLTAMFRKWWADCDFEVAGFLEEIKPSNHMGRILAGRVFDFECGEEPGNLNHGDQYARLQNFGWDRENV